MAVRGVHAPVRQAVALEPEMLVRLEQYIQERNKKDDKFAAAVGAWVCAVACLRFTHAQRARLVSRSASSVVIFVYKGKARIDGARRGYQVRIPRRGLAVGAPADWLWDLCHQQRLQNGDYGIIRDPVGGAAFTPQAFIGLMRTIVVEAQVTTTPEHLTSYSLRRFLPTGADALLVPVDLRNALGSWQGSVDARISKFQAGRCMPIRYSGGRSDTEEQIKLYILEAVRVAQTKAAGKALTWAVVRCHAPSWSSGDLQAEVAAAMDDCRQK